MELAIYAQPFLTMSAEQLADVIKQSVSPSLPQALWQVLANKADLDVLERLRRALGGQFVLVPVHSQTGLPTQGTYLSVKDTAYVDAGRLCSTQLQEPGFDASNTSSIGVGELCASALRAGHRQVVLILNHVGVHDFGLGIAAGLGVRFTTDGARPFIPMGRTMSHIKGAILNPSLMHKNSSALVVWSDTTAPLLGTHGVVERYQRSGEATPETLAALEEGARTLNSLLKQMGHKFQREPLTGGGYGMAAGLRAFINATLKNGSQQLERLLGNEEEEPEHNACPWLAFLTLPEASASNAKEKLQDLMGKSAARVKVLITTSPLKSADWAYASGVDYIVSDVKDKEDLQAKLKNVAQLLASVVPKS